ncbi:MAG: peptidase MA family metallohydrolase [Dehalococcoidia bacterium]
MHGLHRLLLLGVVGLLPLVAVSVAAGDEEGIQVVSTSVESRFPDGILFHVEASSPDQIEEIRVTFRTVGNPRVSYNYLEFSPGTRVEGEWLLSIKGGSGQHIPPGTQIAYQFEVSDGAGRTLTTEEEVFLYMDNRFDWMPLSQDQVTVYHYGPTERRAEIILEAILETVDQMSPVLGLEPSGLPIRVIAYNNFRHMIPALPPRTRAAEQELITQGQAWSEFNVLLILAFEPEIRGIASHEVTHILVHAAAGGTIARVPAWLNEGLAEYANLEPGLSRTDVLRFAIFTRRLGPLWHLVSVPGDPTDVVIFYAQTHSVVEHLIETYGAGKMRELFQALQAGSSIEEALQQVYGLDQYELDSQWRQRLGLRPLPPPEEMDREPVATPTPTPSTVAEPTPFPEATPVAPAERKRRVVVFPACNVPVQPQEGNVYLPLDLALLGLLGGPALLFTLRWRGRKGGH